MDGDIFEVEDRFLFTKNSFLTVGNLNQNCVKLLTPVKANSAQPLFLGDSRGVLYLTEYKKTEPEIKARTQPFQRKITCIDLNSNISKEKIYFSFGNSIFMTNRFCKDYSKIEFDIADDINLFKVQDNLIWTVSNHHLSKYEFGDSTTEKGTYDNEQLITSLCLSEFFGKVNPVSIIGTEDEKLKIVSGKDLIYTLPVNSSPTAISPWKSSLHDISENNYLFGTLGGSHGILSLEKNSMKVLWENNKNKNLSEIVSIKTFDINYDGLYEIFMIRKNGDINVYSVGNTILDTSMISKYSTGEILTGIDIGKFRNDEETEIILTSYSGLVFSLAPQLNVMDMKNNMNNSNKVVQVDSKNIKKNMKELQSELENYKKHLEEKKELLSKQQNTVYNPVSKNPFQVNYKFTLQPQDALFNLKLESEFPMELILMQSLSVSADIIEIPTRDVNYNVITDKNISSTTNMIDSKFLSTFKLKESVHQVEILLRTYEGNSDIINCTIIPYNKPKTAFTLEIPIKSLSLHKKIDQEFEANTGEINDAFADENCLNVLVIKGKFQASEINQIFSLIVPGIPEKTAKESLKYYLKSTFLNTYIELVIENNFCQIRSIFLSPLIIIKEQVTKESRYRKKEMEFGISVKTISVFKILEIIDPMIEENFNLETKYKIIQAFKEIDINNTNKKNQIDLPDEYKQILNNSEIIIKKHEQRTINLNYLKILVENLLKDVSKVKTINNINDKIKDLQDVFEDYSYDKLVGIFKELKNI